MANLYFNGPLNVFRYDETLAQYTRRDPTNPLRPSYGSSAETAPQVEAIQFGNGYMQIAPTSLRPVQRAITLTFERRTQAVITALTRFFTGEGGNSLYQRSPADYFFWQPLPELGLGAANGQQLAWVVLEPYSITPSTFNATTFSVKLTEWRLP